MGPVKLEIRNLTKAYPGILALRDFSAVFHGGKVYALLGKNGSGKSTFVKCLSGAVVPTSGQILLDGRPVSFRTPVDAAQEGFAVVYQELSLILDFTVAENILLGRYVMTGPGGRTIDWRKTNRQAAEILESLKIDIPVTTRVADLSVGQRQVIEIAKAMAQNPRVLFLDEPTSALARHEIESLMDVVRTSRDQGVVVIFITHKLSEIRGIADYVTVLRDNTHVGTVPISEATPKMVVHMMFGETALQSRPADLPVRDEVRLKVCGLTRANKYENIDFEVHAGEILGIAGMLGAGRSELLRGIFGADPIDAGHIVINGETVTRPSIQTMKRLGLGMTMENRKDEGLIQIMSIQDNLCMAGIDAVGRGGFISNARQAPVTRRWIERLQIRAPDPMMEVQSLSGGNQQKVVVGSWLNTDPSVMFFDEPTRGIDIQAKQQIFQIMWELSRKGLSVVFVSSELEELLEVCHRIIIMESGRFIDEVRDPENTTIDQLYALCMAEAAR
ncbi:MAG: sugar ABC transporter ATP-binding protein [Azospirillaceae bacterium]|nr:sugar ABC transporter ATP-binding protein [Azospirillaceae bacterium]